MLPCLQSARIESTLFGPASALYREYLHGVGYTNIFAEITGLYGMGEIDVSKPMAPAWESARVYQCIKDLRKEAEPRVKLAMTVTGRSDPTFYMSCVGQNPVLLALLYCILKTNLPASSIFRPLFCRDLGEIGLDTLDISDPPVFSLSSMDSSGVTAAGAAAGVTAVGAAAGVSAVVSRAMGSAARNSSKRSVSSLSLFSSPTVDMEEEEEEAEEARESKRAAKVITTGATLKAGQEAATLMKMMLELPEAERGALRNIFNESVASLIKDKATSTSEEPATPPVVFSS